MTASRVFASGTRTEVIREVNFRESSGVGGAAM